MNRTTSFALVVLLCSSALSAQAAPKGKVGNRKPMGMMKANGTNVGINKGIGNITNPIVNTPPKAAPGFPYNPGLPKGGHGPVVLNPIHHGPINGLPVFPYKPRPTCGSHNYCYHYHYHYRYGYCGSMQMASTGCSNTMQDDSSNDASPDQSAAPSAAPPAAPSADQSADKSTDQSADASADQSADQSPDMDQ